MSSGSTGSNGSNGAVYRQAVEEAMELLAGSWAVAVLAALAPRRLQYSVLLGAINDAEQRAGWVAHQRPLSEKVLSQTLSRMQRDGLVSRHRESEFPPVTWYQITPLGRSLLAALRPLAEWSLSHRDELGEARDKRRNARQV
ncbi:MAG TPA: helix-turn-helix domain-containing protein [Pseudonocardiaceae bacterium]|nr:helix-turn-helix domain-containing protein [Pseudonocardiaceae bacterium]